MQGQQAGDGQLGLGGGSGDNRPLRQVSLPLPHPPTCTPQLGNVFLVWGTILQDRLFLRLLLGPSVGSPATPQKPLSGSGPGALHGSEQVHRQPKMLPWVSSPELNSV